MPFRRRRARRRRPRRRRRFRARRMIRRRRVVIDPEKKDLTTFNANVQMDLGGVFRLLNGTDAGVGTDERIGRQMVTTSYMVDGNIQLGAGATGCQFVKIWLIWDRQPQGITLNFLDYLANPAFPTVSPRNLENRRRIKVMWSRSYRLDVFNPCAKIKIFKRLKVFVRHNDPTAGIASIESGALWLVLSSDEIAGPTAPVITFSDRIRFVG